MMDIISSLEADHNRNGLSLVITTYRRNRTLYQLLKSLLMQEMNFPLEVVLINNYAGKSLSTSMFSLIGRLIAKIPNLTIHNLSTNVGCSIRYPIASFAKYDTIMFLDDDIELISPHFIQKMYDFLWEQSEYDIVSCWCAIFREDLDYFNTEGRNFEITTKSTEVDLVGPGISMFRKKLLQFDVINIPQELRDVDNIWFSIMPSLLLGSQKYYFPSKGMLKFIRNDVHAMFKRPEMEQMKRDATTKLVSLGYSRIRS